MIGLVVFVAAATAFITTVALGAVVLTHYDRRDRQHYKRMENIRNEHGTLRDGRYTLNQLKSEAWPQERLDELKRELGE